MTVSATDVIALKKALAFVRIARSLTRLPSQLSSVLSGISAAEMESLRCLEGELGMSEIAAAFEAKNSPALFLHLDVDLHPTFMEADDVSTSFGRYSSVGESESELVEGWRKAARCGSVLLWEGNRVLIGLPGRTAAHAVAREPTLRQI